jgi:gliding motility-associated-like protein
MKKATLVLFLFLISFSGFAQLPLESFETAFPPANWLIKNELGPNVTWAHNQVGNPGQPPHTGTRAAYLNREIAGTGITEDWLVTPGFPAPANAQLRFWSRLTIGGNQGTIYEIRVSTTSQSDPAQFTTVQTWTETQINPAQEEYVEKLVTLTGIPAGQQVYVAFVMRGTGPNGDRWLVDDVQVVEKCLEPTALTAGNITQTTADLSWGNPSGATSWEIEVVPVATAPTGSGVVYNGTLPYTAPGLTEDTDYKYYVRALCTPTNSSDWVGPFNFSTVPTGATCSAPIIINTLPFSASNNTSNFGDDFEGTPGATGCGTTGNFLNGDEVVYAYTAAFTGTISVSMTGNGANSAMFVYNSCANIGVSCVAGGTGNATTPVNLPSISVTAGTTYYIVISSSTTQSTPYNLIIQQVNCPQPTGLTASDVNATSANLSWAAGTATSWEVFVQTAGAGIPAGAGTTTTVNTNYNVTQTTAGVPFTSATAYEYYVRADCNNGTFSAWSGPFAFSTTQVPVALNYSENFEGFTGWSLSNGTQTNKWVIGTAVSNGGANSLYVSNDNGVTNTFTNTVTSTVHAYRDIEIPAGANEVSLSFDWRSGGESTWDYIRVWSVPTSFVPTPGTLITAANSGGTQIGGNHNLNAPNWSTSNYVLNVSAFQGQIRRLVFEWRNDGSGGVQPAGAIDNVNINLITCSAPSALTLTNVTLTDATISWTAPASVPASYDYYISTSGTPPTASTTPTGNTTGTSVTIPGLSDSTNYNVWVRSNCGAAGTSFWTGPLNFNTPQVPATLPLVDGFEGTVNWSLNNGTQVNKWTVGTATSNGGTHSLYVSNDNGVTNAYTIANAASTVHAYRDLAIPAGANQAQLSFDWKSDGENNWDYIRVWLVPVTFTPAPGTQITAANSGGTQIGGNFQDVLTWTTVSQTLNVAAFAGQSRRLVFEWRNDTGGGANPPGAIDNVNISIITCPAPTNLTLTSVALDQATFAWTAPTWATPTYDYYISTTNTAPTAATTPTGNVAATTATETGLTPSTTYYVWVRSNCGATDGASFWIGPLAISTPQIPATLPLVEGFEGTVPWTISNGTQVNKWVVGTATANGGTHSLYVSNDNGVSNFYVETAASVVHAYRDLAIPSTANEITVAFDWKGFGESTFDYVRVWLVPVTFNPTPGTLITAANSGGTQLGGNFNQNLTWTTASFDVPVTAFAGQSRRIIFEWRNDPSVSTQPPGAIDNVNISVVTCAKPTTLTATGITQTTATLGWTEVGTATSWEVYHGLAGIAPPTAATTGTVVTTNSLPLTDLVSGTTYVFYVRSLCGGTDGNSNWAGPFTFTTQISNDECDSAIVAPVNNNSLCTVTTPGTLAGATASPQANGCAGTADDDVWFEFTATHTQHYIALLNAGGQALNTGNMVHAVYSGDQCGSLTQLYCSDPNNSIANNLVVGQTYKIRVYSNASTPQTFTFRLCIGVILTCANSESFCANADQGGVTFPGSIGVPNLGSVSCLGTTPNPTYYFLQIAESGNLQMNLSQTSYNGTPIDVDFIAYGPFASLDSGCENLTAANEVDCSYSASAVEPFTIPNALVGEYYIVLITNFNGTQGTINFTQPNFGAPGAGATDCTIVCTADLGPDQVLCGVTEYDLDANIINATSYTWFKDGVVIPGATSQIYTATESGVYSVEVVKAACPTNPTDSMTLTLIPTINVPDPAQVTTCGDAGTGSVDLSTLSAGILGILNPADYVVEYYPTQADATAGTNQIDASVPFVTSSQTIYVRIESALLDTCFDVVPLPIVVNTSANADISYAGSPFCSSETTGVVTLTGDTGGTFTAEPSAGTTGTIVIDPATGTIDISASTAGTYTVTYTIAATAFCPAFSDTFDIVIFEAPTAAISYSGSPYCSNGGTATVTLTGTTGGTYSSTAGLVIDAATGDIDLAASTPDTYTITYTTAATADCPSDQFTTQVTITALPVATIDYGTAPYCSNGGTITVAQTGAAGGTYTSTAGLVIDPATGDVNLNASTAGTYTVTYTVPAASGCPAVPATASITINALPVAAFTYDSATYCVNFGSTVAPSFAAGAVAGTFSAPAGLAIDPVTGQINPSASTPNTTYTVTNTIAAANGCGVVTATFDVTIIDAPLPTFTFGGPYCQNDADPSPAITGVAGTFSATPAGLAINPSTGTIDLSASQAGTYEVRNTMAATAECAEVYHAVMVEVNSTPVFVFSEGCEGNTYKLEVVDIEDSFETDNAIYTWTGPAGFTPPAFNTPEIEPVETGEYIVTVTTPDGCINSLPFTVESTSCLIQKGISPGDGADNNTFDLTALNVTRISIFNRYGQEVFSYGNYTNQWGGQDNSGNELPTGTYFYSFERANGETKTGWIYVNRQN